MTHPFDDIEALILGIPHGYSNTKGISEEKLHNLARPTGNLGQLDSLPEWYSNWGKTEFPQKYLVVLFAATHGLSRHNIFLFEENTTTRMVSAYSAGGGTINQLCQANALGLQIFELALESPTRDILAAPALTAQECAATFAYGMECLASEPDILALGSMSIGGCVAAAAIFYALYGGDAKDWLVLPPHSTTQQFETAVQLIKDAVEFHKNKLTSPLVILQHLGGREFAAITGAIIAARYQKVPVVIDNIIELAVVAVLQEINQNATSHVILSQKCGTFAHKKIIRSLGLKPILDFNISLNEGVSASLAMGIIRATLIAYNGTFNYNEILKFK